MTSITSHTHALVWHTWSAAPHSSKNGHSLSFHALRRWTCSWLSLFFPNQKSSLNGDSNQPITRFSPLVCSHQHSLLWFFLRLPPPISLIRAHLPFEISQKKVSSRRTPMAARFFRHPIHRLVSYRFPFTNSITGTSSDCSLSHRAQAHWLQWETSIADGRCKGKIRSKSSPNPPHRSFIVEERVNSHPMIRLRVRHLFSIFFRHHTTLVLSSSATSSSRQK